MIQIHIDWIHLLNLQASFTFGTVIGPPLKRSLIKMWTFFHFHSIRFSDSFRLNHRSWDFLYPQDPKWIPSQKCQKIFTFTASDISTILDLFIDRFKKKFKMFLCPLCLSMSCVVLCPGIHKVRHQWQITVSPRRELLRKYIYSHHTFISIPTQFFYCPEFCKVRQQKPPWNFM